MSLETGLAQRSTSPTSSGRSSPGPSRARRRNDDGPSKKDKSYRRYASGVERALALFDSALQEWADYISFLGRLLKTLQSKPSGCKEIPHKAIVAKRLAQCLKPELPSGVHQKTLEVYAYVFTTLGANGLERDLALYLPGLAPILAFASLSIKPALLSLFENYILGLSAQALRPALKSIILALLPGLEEESSEEFEHTLGILDRLKGLIGSSIDKPHEQSAASGDQLFWQCLFLASITSASRRPGALAYLVRYLPRLGTRNADPSRKDAVALSGTELDGLSPEIEAVALPEPGLLIRCFCAGLRDGQVLVQRGFLDLLVTHLPLHSIVLQEKTSNDDLGSLIAAASSLVARRDMSLNRRLWTWFLGPEPSTDTDSSTVTSRSLPGSPGIIGPSHYQNASRTQYFEQHGLRPLVKSIKDMLKDESQNPAIRARPFRICLSLMDRWETGVLVVPQIFLPAMESVWRCRKVATSQEFSTEVLRSANMFFDGVESGLIWSELIRIIIHAFDTEAFGTQSAQEQLDLVLFIVTNFNIHEEEEMLTVHMPIVSLAVLVCIHSQTRQQTRPQTVVDAPVHLALRIASRLIEVIPPRAFASDSSKHNSNSSKTVEGRDIVLEIQKFYTSNQANSSFETPTFLTKDVGKLLLDSALGLVARDLKSNQFVAYFDLEISILDNIIKKVPNVEASHTEFASELHHASQRLAARESEAPFPVISSLVLVLETVCTYASSRPWLSEDLVRQDIPNLVRGLWPSLSPSRPRYNVEAVRCLWRLQSISPDTQLVESSITTFMVDQGSKDQISIEGVRRFITIWTHSPSIINSSGSRRSSLVRNKSKLEEVTRNLTYELPVTERPLMLLLDVLEAPKCDLFVFVTTWLQSLTNFQVIIDLLVSRLQTCPSIVAALDSNLSKTETNSLDHIDGQDDWELCVYYLNLISNVLQYSSSNVWLALASMASSGSNEDHEISVTIQSLLARICLMLLTKRSGMQPANSNLALRLNQTAVTLLQQFLLGPSASSLMDLEIDTLLIKELTSSVEASDVSIQVPLMETILIALRISNSESVSQKSLPHRRTASQLLTPSGPGTSVLAEREDTKSTLKGSSMLPPQLLQCLKLGLSSQKTRPLLDNWVLFLDQCLQFYSENIFQILIPLIECLNSTVNSVFERLQVIFGTSENEESDILEPAIASLLNGLEQVLARSHERLVAEEIGATPVKSPEHQQGFFGNMVSGVFNSETNRPRFTAANNRLTVLLCIKDVFISCFGIWSWADYSPTRDPISAASFNYTAIRLRNRTRRIFEHLFTAEGLECLETVVELWSKSDSQHGDASTVLNLLNVLDGSRPKNAIPAIFDALYSRINPSALDPARKSTLTSDFSDLSLAAFLVSYARSLDDDAMDEIWNDCVTFLKDVLANPMPHRQILPRLVEFTAIIGEKVDNTNFGEQRRMRRDLGDLFVRLLTATFTTRPLGFSGDTSSSNNIEKASNDQSNAHQLPVVRKSARADDVVTILALIVPNLSKILIDSDRTMSTASMISAQVLTPTIRSKMFPENVTKSTLDLVRAMTSVPEAAKFWKKDVAEAFNDTKFFAISFGLAQTGWMPILKQLATSDKDRMPEFLSRLSPPTSAGIVFGVGASSARLEADRRTQLNLRRIATFILSATDDFFVVNLPLLQEKLVELMTATAASSPSSTTRAEIYMVFRALVLKTSAVHLSSFWPIINLELHDAIYSSFPDQPHDTYNIYCVFQACKLLDTLLTLGPDDFQLQEWLFITDTADAVYRPADWDPVALVDELADELDSAATIPHSGATALPVNSAVQTGKTRPMLCSSNGLENIAKEELMDNVLRPFFRQLSIFRFESTYGMGEPDWQSCYDDLLRDLFEDSTLV